MAEPGGKITGTRPQGQPSTPGQTSGAIVRRTGSSLEKPAEIKKVEVRDVTNELLPKLSPAKPRFKPEALPKPSKITEPAGELVPTRGPKPTFKPEALPKLPKTSEPAGALVPTRGPKQTLDTLS